MSIQTTTTMSSGESSTLPESQDYQILMTEIKSTIDKNDLLFNQIQQSNYPNAGSYSSDLINYKIDAQVTDLTKARQQIWDFLNKKYAENTNLRKYYFDEIRKVDEHIKTLSNQQQDIIDSIQGTTIKSNNATSSIKNEKYTYDKMQYYLFLYKILIGTLVLILGVILLCIIGSIPKATGLIMTVIILIALSAFVGYYVFYVNIGRSMFSWSKFEHDNSISSSGAQCSSGTAIISKDAKLKQSADSAVNAIIEKSINDGKKCGTQPTGTQPTGIQPTGTQPTGTQPTGTQSSM